MKIHTEWSDFWQHKLSDNGGRAKQGHISTSISQTRDGCHNNTLLIHVRNNKTLQEVKKFLHHT
jgi:hypothetical protein